jgi:hypothetical protein
MPAHEEATPADEDAMPSGGGMDDEMP